MRSTKQAAGVYVENPRGEILFVGRRDGWGFPCGKVEADEAPEQAAVRETFEETGYVVVLCHDVEAFQAFEDRDGYEVTIFKATVAASIRNWAEHPWRFMPSSDALEASGDFRAFNKAVIRHFRGE